MNITYFMKITIALVLGAIAVDYLFRKINKTETRFSNRFVVWINNTFLLLVLTYISCSKIPTATWLLLIAIGFVIQVIVNTSFKTKKEKGSFRSVNFFSLSFLTIGLCICYFGDNLMHYYLGLEIISFSLIIAVGCQKKMLAAEAAIKLFLVSAFSSGLFLLGISMFYKSFGSICIEHIFWFRDLEGQKAIYFMILALFIKTPTFPFYVWYADLFEGSSWNLIMLYTLPVIAYFSIISQLITMVDIFIWPDLYSDYSFWNQNLLLFITIGIFFLSLIATKQNKITRLLAYSSAANSSILLLAFLSEPQLTKTTLSTVFLYYIMYIVNTICIFLILKFIKKLGLPSINKSTDIRDLQNFYLNFPLPAIFLIFLLLSVGGVPPLIGFITKFNLLKIIFFSLNDISMFFFVTSFVILSSVLLLFCYLRIVSSIIKGNTEFIKNKISLNSFKNLPNKIRILLIANFSFNVFVIFHIDEIIFILSNLWN